MINIDDLISSNKLTFVSAWPVMVNKRMNKPTIDGSISEQQSLSLFPSQSITRLNSTLPHHSQSRLIDDLMVNHTSYGIVASIVHACRCGKIYKKKSHFPHSLNTHLIICTFTPSTCTHTHTHGQM